MTTLISRGVGRTPSGAGVYEFPDGFSAGWSVAWAKPQIRFETVDAAIFAWELAPRDMALSEDDLADALAYAYALAKGQSGIPSVLRGVS